MKTIIVALALISPSAFAYSDGTYNCKNSSNRLPDNQYKISTQTIGSAAVPYVEITRHFLASPSNPSSPVQTATVRGFAIVSAMGETETLSINAVRLEFENGALTNCKQ